MQYFEIIDSLVPIRGIIHIIHGYADTEIFLPDVKAPPCCIGIAAAKHGRVEFMSKDICEQIIKHLKKNPFCCHDYTGPVFPGFGILFDGYLTSPFCKSKLVFLEMAIAAIRSESTEIIKMLDEHIHAIIPKMVFAIAAQTGDGKLLPQFTEQARNQFKYEDTKSLLIGAAYYDKIEIMQQIWECMELGNTWLNAAAKFYTIAIIGLGAAERYQTVKTYAKRNSNEIILHNILNTLISDIIERDAHFHSYTRTGFEDTKECIFKAVELVESGEEVV